MDKSEHAIQIFDKRANDYQSRFMDVGLYHDTLDSFCEALKPNARILELACGPGNLSKYLLEKRSDFNLTGTDLAPNMIALAKANNPGANYFLMDIRLIAIPPDKYDGVICGFGLPYLTKDEAISFIETLPKIVNGNAVVYLSTMEGEYSRSRIQKSSDGKDEMFIHFHESEYLVAALEIAGFEITLQKRQSFPGNSETLDLILIAVKK